MARFPILALGAAVVAAIALGSIADYLGIPSGIIRSGSLMTATFLGIALARTVLSQRNN